MDITKSMATAASGMRVQSDRMRVIAENVANASSTAAGADGQPYRRQILTFREAVDEATGASVVEVAKVARDSSDFRLQYNPGHPAANEQGYVTMPNVSVVDEMVNMISASRSYQTNAEVMNTAKQLLLKTLTLGQ